MPSNSAPILRRTAIFLIALAASLFGYVRTSHAILVYEPTLSEIIAEYDVAVFCRLVGGASAVAVDDDGNYAFEVTEILNGAEALKNNPGAKAPYRFETQLFGEKPTDSVYFAYAHFDWRLAVPVNDREQQYLHCLAKPSAHDGAHVKALLTFLEAAEGLIADDLPREFFERVPYDDVRKARDALPVAKLRNWIADPKAPVDRRICLLLLSVCGTKDDLPMLKSLVLSAEKNRDTAEMSFACYLIFGGEQVLSSIEETYFKPQKEVQKYWSAADRAFLGLSFAGRHTDVISRERQIAVFRPLLNVLQRRDAVVLELARLEDWDSTAQLIELSRIAFADSRDRDLIQPIAHFFRRSPKPEAKTRLEELTKLDPGAVDLYEEETP